MKSKTNWNAVADRVAQDAIGRDGTDHEALVAASTIAANAATIGRVISRDEAIAGMVRAAERRGLTPRPTPGEVTAPRATTATFDPKGFVGFSDAEDDDDADDEKPEAKPKEAKTKTRTPFDTHAMATAKPVKVRSEIADPYLAAVVGETDAHRAVNKLFRARTDAKWQDRIAARGNGGPGSPSTTAPPPMTFPSMVGGSK